MFTRRQLLVSSAAASFSAAMSRPVLAGQHAYVFNTGGTAINGYDPVAYFTEGKPVKGSMLHALKWEGAIWVFASKQNEETFMMNPRAFAPQYGGYCAYAMSKGAIATTEPDAWTIHEGKLYLNFNTTVRGIWAEDISGNVALANGYWPSIVM